MRADGQAKCAPVVIVAVPCAVYIARPSASPSIAQEEENHFSSFSSLVPDLTEVVALAKGVAELPCDVTSPDPTDPVRLVLWYRTDSSSTPIYR